MASQTELDKLKGDFAWGMPVSAVRRRLLSRIEADFASRIENVRHDPTSVTFLREELGQALARLEDSYVTFDGQATGFDVSIVDKDFAHNTGESMLVSKNENGARYFFFQKGRLYKMFTAFDQSVLRDRSFRDFGGMMQARFGRAVAVHGERTTKEGTEKV